MAQVFSKERAEYGTSVLSGFVTDMDAALVQYFLTTSITQPGAVVEPNGVLNDAHLESATVGHWFGHAGSTELSSVKAIQPKAGVKFLRSAG